VGKGEKVENGAEVAIYWVKERKTFGGNGRGGNTIPSTRAVKQSVRAWEGGGRGRQVVLEEKRKTKGTSGRWMDRTRTVITKGKSGGLADKKRG